MKFETSEPRLVTNRNDTFLSLATCRYSIVPRSRKYIKRYGFLSFARNLPNKYGKQLLDTATKIGLDALETASKK